MRFGAVRYAARPSLSVIPKPHTNGEYSMSFTYTLSSSIGSAENKTFYSSHLKQALLRLKPSKKKFLLMSTNSKQLNKIGLEHYNFYT